MSCSKDTRHNPGVYGSPKSSGDLSDKLASSAGSMDPHGNHLTPSDNPASPGSPESPTASVNIARLSLENHRRPYDSEEATREVIQAAVMKRAASTELWREPPRYSLSGREDGPRTAVASSREGVHREHAEHGCCSEQANVRKQQIDDHQGGVDAHRLSTWHDSTYQSRKRSMLPPLSTCGAGDRDLSSTVCMGAPISPSVESSPKTNQISILSVAQTARWSGLILQPDSLPVSEEQLRLEIKAIYAGLMIAEARCMNLDAAQGNNPSIELDNSQWQESIAFHRTYLYEHHDFLMASQHPSATPDLKALPTMYSMPARMWKYGIHDFLEVLRSRRPSSQDYMLSFIILAYQMMMLFYETAPIFSDTWIECLGDLARYRMSMEEEKEAHAQWGRVAASWYIKGSDRHPQIGRLYHHLTILERPSLRKFACYGKSLTCVVPFPNARDSLRTLCIPIAGVAQPACSSELLSEASFCKLHALIFLAAPEFELAQASNTAMSFLQQPGAFKWRDCGMPLAVANISALLGYGSNTNSLCLAFDFTIQRVNEQTMLSHSTKHNSGPPSKIRSGASEAKSEENWRLLQVSKWMTLNALYTAMRCPPGVVTFQDSLAFIGVMFCFIHILCLAEREAQIDRELYISLRLQFGPDEIEWALVAGYLNHLAQLRPVTDHLVQCAQQGLWLKKPEEGEPLPEDFSVRGLVWAYFAFCPGWFDSDEDEDLLRNVGTSRTHEARADRPLYYGLRLAFETPYLSYDETSATFSARSGMTTSSIAQALPPLRTDTADLQAQHVAPNPNAQYSPPSAPASSASDSDYLHVKRPAKQVQTAPSPKT